MARILCSRGINLTGSIHRWPRSSEGLRWGELEENQAVIRAADGIAILLAAAGLARGFWSNWKQTWLGFWGDKMCVGVILAR